MLNPKIGTLPEDWQNVPMNESWLPDGRFLDYMSEEKYRYRGIPIWLKSEDEFTLRLYYYDVYINIWVEATQISRVISSNNLKNILNMTIDCIIGPKTIIKWSRRSEALLPK
jgi:hypothetical protein